MRQEEIDILNLENRLLQDRKALNDLIYWQQQTGAGRSLMDEKLENMQREIDYMGNQLKSLKAAGMMQAPQPVQEAQLSAPQAKPQPVQEAQLSVPQAEPQPVQEAQLLGGQNQTQPPVMENNDLEKTFGKSWMGVIASGLVFISFVIFASLVIPSLSDSIKIMAMFAVSFVFVIVGFAKLNKDCQNKFYLAVSGCGLGAVYISILVSNIYFKAVGDIMMYLMVFVWALCVCFIARKRSIVFQAIGQLGITISAGFGCMVCTRTPDEIKFLMLTGFFAVTSVIFMTVHRRRALAENAVNLIFNGINLCWFLVAVSALPDSMLMKMSCVVLLVYIVAQLAFCYMREPSEDGLGLGIINAVYIVLTVLYSDMLLRGVPDGIPADSAVMLLTGVIFMAAVEYRLGREAWTGKYITEITATIMMYLAVCNVEEWHKHVFLAGLMIPSVCAGFLKKNWVFKYAGLAFMVHFMFNDGMDNPEKMLWGIVFFALVFYFLSREKQHYHSFFKLSAYCMFLLKILMDCVYVMSLSGWGIYVALMVTNIITGILNLTLLKTGIFGTNPVSGEKERETKAVFYLVHMVQMQVVLLQILLPPAKYSNFICIPWALVLFLVNTKKLLASKHAGAGGVYAGIKFTVFLLVVLASYDVGGVYASVSFFALSVACIAAGFWFGCKSVRVYGLALAMLSVFKLVLADIAYGGLLQLSAGFFAAGILCFVISRIYNSIDNKMKEVKNSEV